MSIIYRYIHAGVEIDITDTYECSYEENYANPGRTEYTIEAGGEATGVNSYWGTEWTSAMTNPYLHRDGGNTISPSGSWVKALYFDETSTLVLRIAGNNNFNGLVTTDLYEYLPYASGMWNASQSSDMKATFSTNIPIFETQAEAEAYCAEEDESERQAMIRESAVNYVRPEYDKDTELYFIIEELQTVTVKNGTATPTASPNKTYRTTKFYANTMPALWFVNVGADFVMNLSAPDVLSGYSLPAPETVFNQVDENDWNDYTIGYSGNYYSDMNKLIGSGYDYPPNGEYRYATYLYTNIPVMENEQAAEDAIESGDYSAACNWDNVSNGVVREPNFGQKETATTFGDGTFSSPFVAQYVMSASDVRKVSSIFFDDDQGLIDDIKKGLELFGSKPVDAIMSLVAFPFDVTNVANCTQTYGLYFGSYKHTLDTPINKIGNLLSNYLNAGTIYLAPLFGSYRDYKNITLSVFLPFIGWRDLEIEKYIKKSVNIRYYIDINTRQCAAVLVADGIMTDYFVGEIGIELPIVGSNFADYARSALQHIGNTAKSFANPMIAASNIGNASASMGWAGVNGLFGIDYGNSFMGNYTQYKLGQNGSPKDMQMTKGSFSSGVGMYLPQYVMFRYDVHDVSEPSLLNELCGKPSTASGKISQFSGFLSGRVSRLVTTNMTDSEIQEVMNGLINEGIYV